ncbi:RNA polymerase sigma factor [Mucilaginibacter sp. AW1-3]
MNIILTTLVLTDLEQPVQQERNMVFEDIYRDYWNKVFRICMGYVNDHAWATDIAQDTFVTIWKKLPTFRNEAAIGTWIYRIAANNCLRQIERDNRMPKSEMPAEIEDQIRPDIKAQTKFLYQCIAELPETDRIVISLELEDIKQAEIAKITGLSESNVRVKIFRIKEKLTQKFKRYEQ